MKYKVFLICITISLFSCSQTKKYKFNYNGGHLYFTLLFNQSNNENQGNFIFDTGSSDLYIDSLYYTENIYFQNKKTIRGNISGAGEKKKTIDVITDSLNFKIGNHLSFTSKLSPILDVKNIVGKNSDGIFGLNFFKNKIVQIDYEKQEMIVHETIHHTLLKDYTKIPLKIINNRYFIEININIISTEIKGLFMIDTGDPGTLTLNNGIYIPKQIDKKTEYISRGVGGVSKGYTMMSNALEIQKFKFKNIAIDISTDKLGALANPDYTGTIGNEILEKFDLIFDSKNSFIYLKENLRQSSKNNHKTLGFSFIDRTDIKNGWVITSLYLNSKAAKNGLKTNDQIMKINGVSVEKLGDEILWKKSILKSTDSIEIEILRNGILHKFPVVTENIFDIFE